MSEPIYRINSPNTVHEIIEGEAIIINMKMGYYYSTDQTGAYVWELLGQNLDMDAMLARILLRYSGEPQKVRLVLQDFLEQLQAENLIAIQESDQPSSGTTAADMFPGERLPFARPELHKYTDLQDLLLLDPIHEVDESGWPSAQAPGSAEK